MLWQILSLAALVAAVAGHGRVQTPPGRATMWRYGFSSRANYDDNGLNCGGFHRQHNVNGGRCGICGDPYDAAQPRAHEIGGTYGQGTIVASYEAGQIIPITVEITAYHRGYWVFKICPNPNSNDQACFDANPIQLADGGTEYYMPSAGVYQVNYRLPQGLVCNHCVLQWRYITGNNWGNCGNGTSALGCGSQENFLACSDIAIKSSQTIPVVPAQSGRDE